MINKRYSDYVSKTGGDPLVDLLIDAVEGSEIHNAYLRCFKLNRSNSHRNYLEACLLATDDFNKISDTLDIPVDDVEMYSKIFFDVVGLDRISRMDLVNTKNSTSSSNLKIWAMGVGLDFIAWRLGKKVTVSPVEGLQDLFSTAIYKSKEAQFHTNTEEASKESTKWFKLSIEVAKLLKMWVMDSDSARRDIELALQEVDPEFTSLDDLDIDI